MVLARFGFVRIAPQSGRRARPIGIPDQAVTIAEVLRPIGYATGQFGKNHLGDLDRFLPTAHGFDEFFGYLYHLDAMEDPLLALVPASAQRQGRAAKPSPQLRHDQRRPDRAAAVGQNRRTAHRR